jgi:hypothetical protein
MNVFTDQTLQVFPDKTILQSREEVLLTSLLRFYKKEPKYLNILAAISRQKTIISLREMDYTVTNYSYTNKVIYELKSGEMFNMYIDYKCQLRGYSKRCLDPFCRRQRIFLDNETLTPIYLIDTDVNIYKQRDDGIVTTIGQLNFFKWAITNEVIDYCFKHKESIDKEMEIADNKKKNKQNAIEHDKTKRVPAEMDEIKVIIQFE